MADAGRVVAHVCPGEGRHEVLRRHWFGAVGLENRPRAWSDERLVRASVAGPVTNTLRRVHDSTCRSRAGVGLHDRHGR